MALTPNGSARAQRCNRCGQSLYDGRTSCRSCFAEWDKSAARYSATFEEWVGLSPQRSLPKVQVPGMACQGCGRSSSGNYARYQGYEAYRLVLCRLCVSDCTAAIGQSIADISYRKLFEFVLQKRVHLYLTTTRFV